MPFFSCDAKLNFQHHNTSVSPNPSEIILIYWFAAQETLIIIINVENSCAASHFGGNGDIYINNIYHIFPGYFDE